MENQANRVSLQKTHNFREKYKMYLLPIPKYRYFAVDSKKMGDNTDDFKRKQKLKPRKNT